MKENIIRAEDIFSPDNTMWSWDEDEYGHRYQYLQYTGDMEELCEEYNITEDRAYELLVEYEEMSKEQIEYEEQVRQDYMSAVLGRSY